MADEFSATPAQIRAATEGLRRLVDGATLLQANFSAGLDPYKYWYGHDDDYARKAGPEYEGNVENVLSTLAAIRDAMERAAAAAKGDADVIADAQLDALDRIGQQSISGDERLKH